MTASEIVGVVCVCIGFALLGVLLIMCIIEGNDEAKKKELAEKEYKNNIERRLECLEMYVTLQSYNKNNDKKN